MNVLITGGAGFVGTRLTRALKEEGHTVISVSRRDASEADISHRLDLSRTDSIATLKALLKGMPHLDVVINAAARQPGLGEFSDFARSNAVATAYLLDALEDTPPRRLIHLSTQSVYAQTTQLPVSEDKPASSSAPFAASKRLGEQIALASKLSPVIVLRLPSLYGKGQGDSFIDGLARTAIANDTFELFSNGQLIRDTLHVSDVIDAVKQAMDFGLKDRTYVMNVGCGRPITTLEYAQALSEVFNSKSEIRCVDKPADQFDLYADISKAQKLIGFRPTELRESLQKYLEELNPHLHKG